MPNYALGQQVPRTDDRIKATYETAPSQQGNGSIRGGGPGVVRVGGGCMVRMLHDREVSGVEQPHTPPNPHFSQTLC
jgi:hypothetical protein